MVEKQTPMLYVGGLSKRVFIATRWRIDPTTGAHEALEKFDITDNFVGVAHELGEDWWEAKADA